MRIFRASAYCGIAAFACISCGACSQKAVTVTTTTGKVVPLAIPATFAEKDWDGKPIALSDYKGKVVLIDFWATSCAPCVAQLPTITAAYHKYHAQGFEVIGVTMDKDRSKMEKFTRAHNMPWPQIKDSDGAIGNHYIPDAHGIPMTVLFGRDGTLLAADIPEAQLSPLVQNALGAP